MQTMEVTLPRPHHLLKASLSVLLGLSACASSDFGTVGCALDSDCPMGDVCNPTTRACATPAGSGAGGKSAAGGLGGSGGTSSGAAGAMGTAGAPGGNAGNAGASGATASAGAPSGGGGSGGSGSIGQFTWSWNGATAYSFTGKGEYQAGPGADQVSLATTVDATAAGYCVLSRHGPGPLSPGTYDILAVPTSGDQFQLQCVTAASPTTTDTVIGKLGKLTIALSSGTELAGTFTSSATSGATNELATASGTFDLPCKAFCQ